MSVRSRAFLTLILAAPVLTEIVSGNTPAHALLHLRIDLFLLMAYSLPLLVIRELALRWNLSTGGLFVLGLAYGIWNEGLLAQTLIRASHVPIPNFDHYIFASGFNFAWAALIVPWHAFLAVILPLWLIAESFPSAQGTWLGKRTFATLSGILVVLVIFFATVRRPHLQMFACFFAIAVLVSTSRLFRRGSADTAGTSRTIIPFVFGFLAYAFFIFSAIALASHRVFAPAYFVALALILAGLSAVSYRCHFVHSSTAARLALGVYFAASVFNAINGIARHSLEHLLTGAILASAFVVLAFAGAFRWPKRQTNASAAG